MVPNEHTKLELIQAQVSFIPEGWKLDKVGTTLKIRNNLRKPISQEVRSTIQGEYPYYGPTRIQDYISEYEQDGTFALIGEDGDHFLKYSTMQQTQFISGKCTVNNHAHILESTTECDSEWFYIFFKHRNITNFLSRQGAGRFKLNKATLEKLPILVPPLQEQRKIAKILSTWDKAISTTERLIDHSKQQKKALMQQLLTGKKRFPGFGEPAHRGELPEGWKKGVLKDSVERMHQGVNTAADKVKYTDEGYPVLQTKHITSGYIDPKDARLIGSEDFIRYKEKYQPRKGSILFSNIGTIGKSCIVEKDFSGIVAWNILSIVPNKKTSIKYLSYVLQKYEQQDYFNQLIAGNAAKFINKSTMESIPIFYPCMDEQQKIANVLTNADKEIELLEQQLADLKQEKKALMQQLLTGKRRVKVDDKEVV